MNLKENSVEQGSVFTLPEPKRKGRLSLEEALATRRSVRAFQGSPLKFEEISQLLWAAQGITGVEGRRTAPSAGAIYPMQIYLVAGDVKGLEAGLYHYRPADHSLMLLRKGDKRKQVAAAAIMQSAVRHCAAMLVIAARFAETRKKYLQKGKSFVYLEAGHVAQNVLLQTVALSLGAVSVGAFLEKIVEKILSLPRGEKVIYLLPLGRI